MQPRPGSWIGGIRTEACLQYTYGWDEAGNLTSRTGPEGTTIYRYDAENRLIEASGPEGTVSFAYDAAGNRIARTTDEGTTTFVVDPNLPYAQVLEETGPGGERVYAYGNDLLNVQGPEGTRWFAYDGLGSTRALTDQGGTLTDEYIYEAFGSMVQKTGTTANDFLFTGEQYEPFLNYYYLRARYYNSATGRFVIRDSWNGNLQRPISLHKYIYAENCPSDYIDPSGKFTIVERMAIVVGLSSMLALTRVGATPDEYVVNFCIGVLAAYEIYSIYLYISAIIAYCNMARIASSPTVQSQIPRNSTDTLSKPGALRDLAVKTYNLVDEIAKQKSAVVISEIKLSDGSSIYVASCSSRGFTAEQAALLEQHGILIIKGPFHAEQNLGRYLSADMEVVRWGISWSTSQKPFPCSTCWPMVDCIGGKIEGLN